MKILVVIGARPQFIKHAPFEIACKGKIELITVHTGQHYDRNMSDVFFTELGMGAPTYLLNLGGGNHGAQTGKMLQEIEPILIDEKPDYLLVYGDTNSTIAGALAAAKLHIPVIHVEAGLRSFNKDMPEEVNRILTDHVSTILFASTPTAANNLMNEGINKNVHMVGDIMTDAVRMAQEITINKDSPYSFPYYFVTIHRPYNTDHIDRLKLLLGVLDKLDEKVVFPIHPRTRKLAEEYDISLAEYSNIEFKDPVSYFENIHLLQHAKHAVTDSGGMQKEAYMLKTPCITVRSETEWNETLDEGWNVLCFNDLSEIPLLLKRKIGLHNPMLYGDGMIAERIVEILTTKTDHG